MTDEKKERKTITAERKVENLKAAKIDPDVANLASDPPKPKKKNNE